MSINSKLSKVGKEIGLALVIVLAMLLPRIFELDKFVTTDETKWLMRSSNFYYALGQREFEKTRFFSSTTGVVTMWVETAAYLIEYPQYRTFGQGYFINFLVFNDFIDEKGIDPLVILSTARVIMVVMLSAVIGLAFFLTKRMIGIFPAMVAFLLISFDPWYLALSRISHTDAPQATFQFVSVLAFISFMYFRREPIMLALSGFFGGIALLSKLPALISGLVFAFLALLQHLQEIFLDKTKRASKYFSASRNYVKILLIWAAIFFMTIVVFWPYVWRDSVEGLTKLISPLFLQLSKFGSNVGITDTVVTDDRSLNNFDYYTRYIQAYFWRTTPVILLGLVVSIIAFPLKARLFKDNNVRKLVVGLFWFIAIYTVAMTIPPKWSARYYLPVNLCLDLIAGIGLATLSLEISSRVKIKREKLFSYGLVAILLVVQLAGVLPTFPYYFSYFNPLLGGGKKAGETTFVGMGEGLDLAAEYLNGKPDAEDLIVMSWIGVGPFSFFFEGDTVLFNFVSDPNSESRRLDLQDVDYLVIYNSQRYRPFHKIIIDLIADIEPEHSIWINDIEYARIYEISTIKDLITD